MLNLLFTKLQVTFLPPQSVMKSLSNIVSFLEQAIVLCQLLFVSDGLPCLQSLNVHFTSSQPCAITLHRRYMYINCMFPQSFGGFLWQCKEPGHFPFPTKCSPTLPAASFVTREGRLHLSGNDRCVPITFEKA